jgi:hypothetical protein
MLSAIERLESRVLLAASLRFSGGVLTVTGNFAADDILVAGSGVQGELAVSVDQTGDGVHDVTERFSGVKSIAISTGAGMDDVTLRNVNITGGVQIQTGTDRDTVEIAGSRLGDPLKVVLGEGNDSFRLGQSSEVQGKVDVNGGIGHDELRLIGGTRVADDLNLAGGQDNDQLELRDQVQVLGSANLALGAGNNSARLEGNVEIRQDLAIGGGALVDSVRLTDMVRVGGKATISIAAGENDVTVDTNVEIRGLLSIVTGANNDDIAIKHSLATGGVGLGRLSITTGAGSDDVDLTGALTIDGATVLNLGADNDRLDLGDSSRALTTVLGGSFSCELGAGIDEFALTRTQFGSSAYINGGNQLDQGDNNGLNSFASPLRAIGFEAGNLRA